MANFQRHTREHLAELIAAAGLEHPGELLPRHLLQRRGATDLVTLDRLYPFLAPNSLLEAPDATPYGDWWHAADPDSFRPRWPVGPGITRVVDRSDQRVRKSAKVSTNRNRIHSRLISATSRTSTEP